VRAFSLATGAAVEIASFYAYDPAFGGGVVVATGDVNGDGVADIITGAGAGGGPHVRAFSLATGAPVEVASFYAYDQAFGGGVFVAGGDIDGDGSADIVTGAGAGGGPHVRAFSLATGTPLEVASFYAYDPAFGGGVRVATGDVNGDGTADIIAGAGSPGGGPHVRAFSLASGAPVEIASFYAYDPGFTGGVSVGSGDVDGDGTADVITGAGPSAPHVRAFSLASGQPVEVASFLAYDAAFAGGVFVAAGGVNGDGAADIITAPCGGLYLRARSGSPSVTRQNAHPGFTPPPPC
jgi:hypothetical protein